MRLERNKWMMEKMMEIDLIKNVKFYNVLYTSSLGIVSFRNVEIIFSKQILHNLNDKNFSKNFI